MFSIANAVKIAVMQVGVIVIGVLAAATAYRSSNIGQGIIPLITIVATNFGGLLLVIPIAWIIGALQIRRADGISDDAKKLAFLSGVAILILLAIFFAYAAIMPWLHFNFFTTVASEE